MVEVFGLAGLFLQTIRPFRIPSHDVTTIQRRIKVEADIAFGGNFFAIVDASRLHLKVDIKDLTDLVEIGMKIKSAANEQVNLRHPEKTGINHIDFVQIYDVPKHPSADYRNLTIYGNGLVDRCPCGSGTSAKMACLHADGSLGINEVIVNESIIGTLFKGKITAETSVASFKAVVPHITGSAYITGIHQFMIDQNDPLKYGFLLE